MQITRNIIRTITTPTFLSGAGIASTSPFIPTYPSKKVYYHSNNNNNKQYTTKGSGKSKKRAVTWMLRREESGCFLLAYGITKDFVYLVYSKNALLGCWYRYSNRLLLLASLSCSRKSDLESLGTEKRQREENKEKRRKKGMSSLHQLCISVRD